MRVEEGESREDVRGRIFISREPRPLPAPPGSRLSDPTLAIKLALFRIVNYCINMNIN